MRSGIADLGLLTVGVLWGSGFIATKISLNSGVSPIYILFLRFTIASIFLLIAFYKTAITITFKDIRKMMLISFILFFAYGFQIVGSKYTSASKAAFYTGTNVMFVPYISWMLNRKSPDIFTYLSTILCLAGIGFISYVPQENLFTLNMGDMLIIVSAIFYGIHIALTGFFSKKYFIKKLILVQNCMASILFGITLLLATITGIGGEVIRSLSKTEFLAVIYIGLVTTGICLYFQASFQRYTSSVKASIFLGTESIFAPIFAYFILKENITKNVILGGVLILLAIILSEANGIIKYLNKKEKIK